MRKTRRLHSVNPERLTTHQLLAEHERVFGPLSKQAKQRLQLMMGGPDMAPQTPQRSERPGKAVALLCDAA
jgi:hypothetical protein